MRSTNEQIPRQHLAAGSSIGVSRLVVVVDRSAVIDIRLPTMGHKTGIAGVTSHLAFVFKGTTAARSSRLAVPRKVGLTLVRNRLHRLLTAIGHGIISSLSERAGPHFDPPHSFKMGEQAFDA
jgi:hypothetical protein